MNVSLFKLNRIELFGNQNQTILRKLKKLGPILQD